MDELERLKSTVELINGVHLDVDKRQEHEETVQLWIRRLKDVLHAANDLFNEISTEELRRQLRGNKTPKVVRCFFSSSNPILFHRQVADEIEKIQKKFNDVAEDMSKLNLNPTTIVGNQQLGGHGGKLVHLR
jgi:flagellar motor protein MotB